MKIRTPEEIRANPVLGDIVASKDYPPGTPPEQILEFEIWDGSQWRPAATAHDIAYHIGTGNSSLKDAFEEPEQ